MHNPQTDRQTWEVVQTQGYAYTEDGRSQTSSEVSLIYLSKTKPDPCTCSYA